MRGLIPLADLVGTDAPLVPAEMQYRATLAQVWVARNDPKPERACVGCIFKGQRSKVCVQAGDLARLAGMEDCESRDVATGKSFIYVLAPAVDERQQTIFEVDHAST